MTEIISMTALISLAWGVGVLIVAGLLLLLIMVIKADRHTIDQS